MLLRRLIVFFPRENSFLHLPPPFFPLFRKSKDRPLNCFHALFFIYILFHLGGETFKNPSDVEILHVHIKRLCIVLH